MIHKEWHLYWPHFKQSLVANVLLVQDLLPRFNDIDPPLWSVAVEYKIYFLFPVLVLIWRRFGAAATLATAAAISGLLMTGFHLVRPQLSLGHICPWYLFLFSMGVCAGSVAMNAAPRRAWPWRWIALGPLALLALSLGAFPITAVGENARYLSHLPLIDVIMGALTACSLIVLTQSAKAAEKGAALTVLNWRPLVFVGTFAYSLYLTHFPLLMFLLSVLDHVHLPAALAPYKIVLFNAAALPVILCGAYVFFVLFERPFLSSRSRRAIASPVSQVAST